MLFNSQFFVFVFLPVTLVVYLAIGKTSRIWALRWIIVASLIFYAWWRPTNVLIIIPALIVNFGIARSLQTLAARDKALWSKVTLTIGIVLNVALLAYFKYVNFAITATNDLFGTDYSFREIVLPLGISFITFQIIAFLIDVFGKRIDSFSFREFLSFVLFFPQLVAGPIVHFREMMPQFRRAQCRWNYTDISVGISLFLLGLFKKVVIADGIAPMVSSIYAAAETGQAVSLIPAWLGAIGFTFQIYFDFSGYSDMALGAARLFGIKLPLNFNSPLRSTNIIDFWLRWHVSLTRFLTAYIYNPIALYFTRRRMSAGRPMLGVRNTSPVAFLQIIAAPILFTMFISGVWHGAGYLFIVWGLLHGLYLSINHAWRLLVQRYWRDAGTYDKIMRPIGLAITFISVAVSMVVFRAPSVDSALNILAGMGGANSVEIPLSLYDRLAGTAFPTGRWLAGGLSNLDNLKALAIWLFLLAPVVFLAPNSLQLMERFEPTVDGGMDRLKGRILGYEIRWRPSIAWACFFAVIGWLAVRNIGGYSEFLYWQF